MIDFKKPFAEAYRAYEVTAEQIDDYVEYWHNHDTGNSLQEFLGMTKDEFYKWIKCSDNMLPVILGVMHQIPICKICGIEMGVKTALGVIMKSCFNGTAICDDCQLEHCLNTDCEICNIGTPPVCQHFDRKMFYIEEDARENGGGCSEV